MENIRYFWGCNFRICEKIAILPTARLGVFCAKLISLRKFSSSVFELGCNFLGILKSVFFFLLAMDYLLSLKYIFPAQTHLLP